MAINVRKVGTDILSFMACYSVHLEPEKFRQVESRFEKREVDITIVEDAAFRWVKMRMKLVENLFDVLALDEATIWVRHYKFVRRRKLPNKE